MKKINSLLIRFLNGEELSELEYKLLDKIIDNLEPLPQRSIDGINSAVDKHRERIHQNLQANERLLKRIKALQ